MLIDEYESKKLLKSEGITITKGTIGRRLDDIESIGINIGFPVVLKIFSPDIVHKSDIGGVVLNVMREDIRNVAKKMYENVFEKAPDARVIGIYVQKMSPPGGIECIVGIKQDPTFGRVIMFGTGGIYAEIVKDISMRVSPIINNEAKQMVAETFVGKILENARGKKYNIDNVVDVILKVSELGEKYNVDELDINPLIVYENEVIAVDARIKL